MDDERDFEDGSFGDAALAQLEAEEDALDPFLDDDGLPAAVDAELPGATGDDLLAFDLGEDEVALVGTEVVTEPLADRIARLEGAARSLAAAEVVREQRRVQRKVSAATTGAGAVGLLPILLQLAGAIDLPPELAATASTVAAIVGAFAGGWVTPERKPPLPASSAHSLLGLGRR